MSRLEQKEDLLARFAESEAADVAEDLEEGKAVDLRIRVLDAADFYRRTCDRTAHFQDVLDALEAAMARRGLK